MSKFTIKNLLKSKKNVFLIALALFLVCASLIANCLSLMIVPSSSTSESVSYNSFSLYMLSLAKSQVESEANSLAGDYQKIGAGGYIWKIDNYYHVISSVYANKNDATLVQNSVKANQGLDSEIVEVNFKSFSLNGNFSADEKKVLTKSLASFYDFYLALYDIAISLDTLVYNEISAKLALNTAHSNLSNTVRDFKTVFPSPSGEIELLSLSLDKALSESQSLCDESTSTQTLATALSQTQTFSSTSQTLSSMLKYHYTSVLDIYYQMING